MPLTIADAESSYSNGLVEFNEWRDEFLARWYKPMAATQVALLLASMSPQEMAGVDPTVLQSVATLAQDLIGGT